MSGYKAMKPMRRSTAQIVEDIEARPKEATETDIRMLVYLYRSQERTIAAQRSLIGELGRKNAKEKTHSPAS